ncbi:TIGR02281 family clan AA aspartic protease [Ramlibacter sp.]|uniref:retropepsin-like aspartic protease family protein n=1 Tax=Ramlibacter sp. TaxID=1917967 RepID=UPI0035B165B7
MSLPGRLALACVLLAAALPAAAQQVALQGMLGGKALLIVDGGAPRAVAPGESHQGVKVVSTQGEQAVIEVGGRRVTLRVGEAPASVGAMGTAPGSGKVIVLPVSSGGHIFSTGAINGRTVNFMVDTGASMVALGVPTADRLGIVYRNTPAGLAGTAGGSVPAWRVKLSSVRVGDVEVREVDAMVVSTDMPYVLLGNTFLTRFQMRRENDLMVLERRY